MPKFKNIKSNSINHWSESARHDKYFKIFFALWLSPIIFILIYTLIIFSQLPTQIPLFYSRPWGEPQLAKNLYIFLPTTGSLLLGITNFAIAITTIQKNKVLSYLLSGTAALISLLASITVFNIINLMK